MTSVQRKSFSIFTKELLISGHFALSSENEASMLECQS